MRVPAYHSKNTTDPDVHHVHDDCRAGRQIPAHNRRQGTNGWPLWSVPAKVATAIKRRVRICL